MSEHEQPTPPEQPPAPEAPTPPAWEPQGPSGPRASFGRRLVAFIVDWIILGVVFGILVAITGTTIAWVVGLLVGVAYYSFFEGGPRGQTPGKIVLDIRVVDFESGGAIGYGRGALRYVGRIISAIPCYLGYFWMLWDREKQCWHDKIATTVVVPTQYYPVS